MGRPGGGRRFSSPFAGDGEVIGGNFRHKENLEPAPAGEKGLTAATACGSEGKFMPVAILLASQRCGTNLFRGILGGHPHVDAFPEIFQEKQLEQPPGMDYRHGIGPFWEYFRERLEADREVAFPNRRAEVVRDYFESIVQVAEDKNRTLLLDVKYNSLQHMNGLWHGPAPIPKMLQYFIAREFPIIHLTRENLARVVISLMHAQTTSQYVAADGAAVERATIAPDPDKFYHHLRIIHQNRETVRRWLRRKKHCLEIRYEDIFAGPSATDLSPVVFQQAADLLNLEGEAPLKALTRKTTSRDLRSVIENFKAVQKRLAGTKFECYLDDSAAQKSQENAAE